MTLPRLTLTVLAACACGAAGADTTLAYVHANDRSPAMTMQVGAGKVRMDMGADGAVIIDPRARKLLILDPAGRRYTEMDPASVAALGQQVSAVRAQMQAAMAGMTDQQRAQMEQMLGGEAAAMLGSAPAGAARLERSAEMQRHAGHDCERARYTAPDGKTGELCIAPAVQMDISPSDRTTLDDAFAFAQQLAEPLRQQGLGAWFDADVFPKGYLLVRSALADEPPQVLHRVSREALDPSRFGVPEGYTRQALPGAP